MKNDFAADYWRSIDSPSVSSENYLSMIFKLSVTCQLQFGGRARLFKLKSNFEDRDG